MYPQKYTLAPGRLVCEPRTGWAVKTLGWGERARRQHPQFGVEIEPVIEIENELLVSTLEQSW